VDLNRGKNLRYYVEDSRVPLRYLVSRLQYFVHITCHVLCNFPHVRPSKLLSRHELDLWLYGGFLQASDGTSISVAWRHGDTWFERAASHRFG
jgi:hypothetical protein